MGFETKVIRAVAEVIERDRCANFYNGTMFVDCDASEAAEIETFLLENVVNCGIVVSKVDREFAFDFV